MLVKYSSSSFFFFYIFAILLRSSIYVAGGCHYVLNQCTLYNGVKLILAVAWFISLYYGYQRTWKPFNPILGETYEMVNHCGITFIAEQVTYEHHIVIGF